VFALFHAQNGGSSWRIVVRGEQQMLAIGRALATNPRLCCSRADEGLAPIIVQDAGRLARLFREERLAAIIVEQHAQKICDHRRALILERGAIVHQSARRRCGRSGPLDVSWDHRA